MKLIDNFKKQIESLGNLKTVWLTTFNLDISFVERVVLPAILKMDPPTSRLDYEGLQQALINSKIDFRIYCDTRVMARNKPKKTSIDIYPISIRNLILDDSPYKEYFDKAESLFHSKVFYLEDVDENIILGAGSANLTLSGWGRNQEIVDFRRVNNRKQYQQIERFFTLIDITLKPFFRNRRKFYDCNEEWDFVHSLDGDTLWQTLAGDELITRLSVWSPYFSKDLAQLIDDFDEPGLKVELVPDLIQGCIRSKWNKRVQAMINSGQLSFYSSPRLADERTVMTHAKLWLAQTLSQNRLAIGSWNFTHRGICSLEDTYWNIEAGIVHPVNSKVSICHQLLEMTSNYFASEQLLEEEKLVTEALLPFDLTVTFNWISSEYKLEGQWFDGIPNNNYDLYLPGISQPITLEWKKRGKRLHIPTSLLVQNSDALLNNQFYRVKLHDQPDWIGVINELNAEYRRTYCVSTLNELLNGYINMAGNFDDENNLQLRDCEYQEENEASGSINVTLSPSNSVSYFRLFHAMKQRVIWMETCQDYEQLYHSIFTAPGCLRELVEKTNEKIVKDLTTKDSTILFNWFLANEVNVLIHFAKTQLKQKKSLQKKNMSIFTVPTSLWTCLQVDIPVLSVNQETEKYIKEIKEEYLYEK